MRVRSVDVSPPPPVSSPPAMRISYGYAASGGGASFCSSDVSVVRTAAGNYDINFNPPFDVFPIVVVTGYNGAQPMAVITTASARTAHVAFAATPGGAGTDIAFMFIAMGQKTTS